MEDKAREQSTKERAAALSVAVGVALLLLKTGAWILTGSVAIFSDALESVVHLVAVVFAAFSVRVASRPEDRSHPYGHGKVEFFSAGIEGIMIIFAATAIILQASMTLWAGASLRELEAGTFLTALAAIITLLLGSHLVRVGRSVRSLTLEADGKHILTDSFTSFAVVAGLAAVYFTGWSILDPLIAIGVAVNILWTGGALLRIAVRGLMDEADVALLDELTRHLSDARTGDCIDIHRLRAWRAGELIHVDAHLVLPRYRSVEEAHALMKKLEQGLLARMPGDIHLILHLDPCNDHYCGMCDQPDCSLRLAPFHFKTEWTLERATAGAFAVGA